MILAKNIIYCNLSSAV